MVSPNDLLSSSATESVPALKRAKTEVSRDKGVMKLRLAGFPSLFGASQVRKFVAKTLQVPIDSIICRKAPQWSYAYLSFRSGATLKEVPSLEALRATLDGQVWKKAKLVATLEEPREDPLVRAEKSASNEFRDLRDQVTPLWRIPYAEQLERKQTQLETVLRKTGLCTETPFIEPIVPSPITSGYRNKCEFTIGIDAQEQATVGFLLGGYREGIVTVASADETLHVPEVLKAVARNLQEYITKSKLPIYNRTNKEGFWRLVLTRIHDGDLLVAVQVSHPAEEAVIRDLVQHMESFRYENRPIASFWIQTTTALHHGIDMKTPFNLKFGQETVSQTLLGLKFLISPLSFFQVNIPATEMLYKIIGDYLCEGTDLRDTILLDLCCGTGTIGLSLAKKVDQVIGIEIIPDAVEDARKNALINGINNVKLVADSVEKAIDKIIGQIPSTKAITVVLDPPRNGVHKSVIKTVRNCERISRVVFVACNAEAATNNFIDLTRSSSKTLNGTPFVLNKARAVDLFPHTNHCELILQFNRNPNNKN